MPVHVCQIRTIGGFSRLQEERYSYNFCFVPPDGPHGVGGERVLAPRQQHRGGRHRGVRR